MTQASDTAAYRFLEAIHERPFPRVAVENAKAAFRLYEWEWDCHCHPIGNWAWPLNELREGGSFEGSEPWSGLLRYAVSAMRTPATGVEAS